MSRELAKPVLLDQTARAKASPIWVYDCRVPAYPSPHYIIIDPIITEDVDCEIVEPKQLPAP